jgi:hypothetical integral membrane protein (TIGR02206 family)
MTDLPFFRNDISFVAYGNSHLSVLFVSALLLALVLVASKKLSPNQNLVIGRCLTVILALSIVVFTIFELIFGRFTIADDLPLSLCNLFALLAPFVLWNPNHKYFEPIYFLVMAGTFQAIVTPDLYFDYPAYEFFKYWITHVGLVLLMIHYMVCFALYPTAIGIVKTFGWLNLYVVVLLPINFFLNANYFYLIEKPINPSVLDFFGPWPVYILVAEILVMGFFAIAMIPVFLAKKFVSASKS